ncbi:MAG: hypothetical protein IIV99_07025, partial [Oscillospiraceae bacterium]|nr:hypothetical protein [Oscillospiraceae bacterium]
MKASMKKNVKAFLAILFSAVLVFEAWGATSIVSEKTSSTQSVVNTTTEDGTVANSDVSANANYYVEPLTNDGYLTVAAAGGNNDTILFATQKKEDGHIGTAMPDAIDSASQETDYYIETVDELKAFQEVSMTNTFEGITVHLAANIDWDGEDFFGIGSADAPFKGTFNGHGYAITKYTSYGNGLFFAVEGATIKNLAIGSAKVTLEDEFSNVGILVNEANGATIENVVIAGSKITTETATTSAIAGMIGKVTGAVSIANSDVKRLTIKTAGMTSAVGGFVGQADAAVTISASDIANSYIRSTYASTTEYVTYFGGIVGYATAAVNATDVDAAAMNIQFASVVKGVGTIAGYLTGDASSFEDCDVAVTRIVTTAKNDTTGYEVNHVGGFVGCVDSDSTFVDCHVANGTIKPQGRTNNLGGFIGSTRSEVILDKPLSGKVTIDACTVANVTAKTASNRACGKLGGLVGLVGEGVSVTNCIVDGFTGPQNTNSSDVAGLIGNVYATDGSATVVASNIVNNINVSGKNYLGTVIGRSTATNGTLEELYYTNVTLNQPSGGNVYECAGAKTPTAEELASAEMAWKLNTINGTVTNTLTWAQGQTRPVYASAAAKATVRVAFTQPSGTVYRYTDATGNVVLPEVDKDYAWPEGTYFVMDTVVNAGMAGSIGTEFPVPMNSAPTAAEYSIKTKAQLESFQDASMNYDFTGITIHMLSDIDWGGQEGGDWLGIGMDTSLPFTGTFDGHGYAIKNLYSETSGLFYIAGSTENPVTIKNLTLENANINSSEDNMAIVVSTICGNPQRVEAGGSASNNPNQILNVNVVDSEANFSGNNCGILIGGNAIEDDAATVNGCTVSGTTLNCVAASSVSNYGMVIGYDGSQGYSRFLNNTIENSKIVAESCAMTSVGMVAGKITGRAHIEGVTVEGCDIELTYATTSTA